MEHIWWQIKFHSKSFITSRCVTFSAAYNKLGGSLFHASMLTIGSINCGNACDTCAFERYIHPPPKKQASDLLKLSLEGKAKCFVLTQRGACRRAQGHRKRRKPRTQWCLSPSPAWHKCPAANWWAETPPTPLRVSSPQLCWHRRSWEEETFCLFVFKIAAPLDLRLWRSVSCSTASRYRTGNRHAFKN